MSNASNVVSANASIVTALNGGNQCSMLEVPTLELEFPYAHIYSLQAELQQRLNTVMDPDGDKAQLAQRLIFWRQCISDELSEIDEHAPFDTPELQKEAAFEIIDILHFVFNLGLELGFTASQIQCASELFLANLRDVVGNSHEEMSHHLQRDLSALINCFPWKSWKTYDTLSVRKSTASSVTFPKYCRVLRRVFAFALYFGIAPEVVPSFYVSKNRHNHERQDNGY